MSILCKIFGHIQPMERQGGWFSPGQEYAQVRGAGTDGINRHHADIVYECDRCGKKRIRLCRIHIPKEYTERYEHIKNFRDGVAFVLNNMPMSDHAYAALLKYIEDYDRKRI